MATNKRKRTIRALAAERGISYTAAMREHDAQRTTDTAVRADLMTFTVGDDEETQSPVNIDFSKSAHALVVGQTGTGKTVFARNLIAQTLTKTSGLNRESFPPVHIFDNPARELSREWSDNTRVKATQVGEDPVEHASTITAELKRRCEAQDAGDEQPPSPVLIILDNYQVPGEDPVEDREFAWQASNWIRIGRAAGLIVVVMQHNPAFASRESIRFSPRIRANFSNRIALGRLTPDDAVLLFGEDQADSTELGALMLPGHALLQQSRGRISKVALTYLNQEDAGRSANARDHDMQGTLGTSLPAANPMMFEIGKQESLANPVTTNFAKSPHALVLGASGTGKTMLARHLVKQALDKSDHYAQVTFPVVHLFEERPGELGRGWLEDDDRVWASSDKDAPTRHALAITEEMERRYANCVGDSVDAAPLLVILNCFRLSMKPRGEDRKLQLSSEDEQFSTHVTNWIRKGRAANMIVVAILHRPVFKSVWFGSDLTPEIRANIHNRIATGRMMNDQAKAAFEGVEGLDDFDLPAGQAKVQLRPGGTPKTVTIPITQEADMRWL